MAVGYVRSLLRGVLPVKVRQGLRRLQLRIVGIDRQYKGLTTQEIFDKVYTDGAWGEDAEGMSISGSGSYNVRVIAPYIDEVAALLKRHRLGTIVDLGCGDFNIGKHFVKYCEKYIACDVSKVIIDRNRKKYKFEGVEFRRLNLAEDELPNADVAFVRQVLQHLSNREIKQFVNRLNSRKNFGCLLVTEHIPAIASFAPNRDKPSGPGIRAVLNSGVVLHDEPFNLDYKSKTVVCEVNEEVDGVDALVRSILYQL